MAFLLLGFISLALGNNMTNITEPSGAPTMEPTMTPTQSPTLLSFDLNEQIQASVLYIYTAVIDVTGNSSNDFVSNSTQISNSFVRSLKDIIDFIEEDVIDRRLIEFQRRMLDMKNITIIYDATLNITITDGYKDRTENITELTDDINQYVNTNDEFNEEVKMDAVTTLTDDLELTIIGSLLLVDINVTDVMFVDTTPKEDDEFTQEPVPLVIIVSVVLVIIIIIVVYLCYADNNKKSNNDNNDPENESKQAFTPVKQKSGDDGKEEEHLSNAVELGGITNNDDDDKKDDGNKNDNNNDANNDNNTANAPVNDTPADTADTNAADTTQATTTDNDNNATTTTETQTENNGGD